MFCFTRAKRHNLWKKLTEYNSRTECHSKMGSIWVIFIQLMQCHTEIKCHIPGNRGWTFGFSDKQPAPPPHPQSGVEREILGRCTLECPAEKCPSGHLVWVKCHRDILWVDVLSRQHVAAELVCFIRNVAVGIVCCLTDCCSIDGSLQKGYNVAAGIECCNSIHLFPLILQHCTCVINTAFLDVRYTLFSGRT